MQEVLGPVVERGVEAITSTNAIHLYYDLDDTLRSWRDLLRPGGRVFVQSGNIAPPIVPDGMWIIDETVDAIQTAALELVRRDDRYARYRPDAENAERMVAYDDLRRRIFLPVRPLSEYVGALERAGLGIVDVARLPVHAHVDQWLEFLGTYHEAVLGWIGGSARIEGAEPEEEAVAERLQLLRDSMRAVF